MLEMIDAAGIAIKLTFAIRADALIAAQMESLMAGDHESLTLMLAELEVRRDIQMSRALERHK